MARTTGSRGMSSESHPACSPSGGSSRRVPRRTKGCNGTSGYRDAQETPRRRGSTRRARDPRPGRPSRPARRTQGFQGSVQPEYQPPPRGSRPARSSLRPGIPVRPGYPPARATSPARVPVRPGVPAGSGLSGARDTRVRDQGPRGTAYPANQGFPAAQGYQGPPARTQAAAPPVAVDHPDRDRARARGRRPGRQRVRRGPDGQPDPVVAGPVRQADRDHPGASRS